jgi:hypothetical protein
MKEKEIEITSMHNFYEECYHKGPRRKGTMFGGGSKAQRKFSFFLLII